MGSGIGLIGADWHPGATVGAGPTVCPAGTGTEAVRASEIRPAAATTRARPSPAPLSASSRVVSPSSPTPTARLAMGLTTVMTGSEIIGQPAW